MRSSSGASSTARSALARPAAPIRARPSAPASTSRRAPPRPPPSRPGDQDPGLAVVDHRPDPRVVGGDRRQAAGHRLDQDDPERLRRLGGQQEEVGGAQHPRQLRVGNRARGSGRARRPRRSPPGAEVRRAARRRRRRPGGRRRPARASASIATSSRLKWWARSSVATKATTTASSGIPSEARSRLVGARRERLGVDAVRHLDQLLRVALARPAQVGDRVRVVGGEHADPVGGPDQRRRDGVLVGLEHAPRALADQAVLVVDEQRLAATRRRRRPSRVSSEPKMNG